MTTATQSQETTSRCDARKVTPGSVFSRHSFGEVVAVIGKRIILKNTDGFQWEIDRHILEQEFSFADQHDSEEKVTRTRLNEILSENPRTAMTVNFNKKVDPTVVAEALKDGQASDESDRAFKKRVREVISGEERTMVGYHFGHFDEHRRLRFTDANRVTDADKGQRTVNPQTINFVVVNRTKFVVK